MKNKERIALMSKDEYDAFLRSYNSCPVKNYIDMGAYMESESPEWVFYGYPARLRSPSCEVFVVEELSNGRKKIIMPYKNDDYSVCTVSSDHLILDDDAGADESEDFSDGAPIPDLSLCALGAGPPVVFPDQADGLGSVSIIDADGPETKAEDTISENEPGKKPASLKHDVPKKHKGHVFTNEERILLDAGLAVDVDTDEFFGQVILLKQRGKSRRILELPKEKEGAKSWAMAAENG